MDKASQMPIILCTGCIFFLYIAFVTRKPLLSTPTLKRIFEKCEIFLHTKTKQKFKKNQMGMSHFKTFCPFIPYIGQVLKEKLLKMMPQRSYDLKTKYGILKMMPPTPLYLKN